MSQSNVIAASLALAFLMFITLRGELPDYLALFKAKPHAPAPTVTGWGAPAAGSSGGGAGGSGGIMGDVMKALPLIVENAPLLLA